jgi:hypothetical protein
VRRRPEEHTARATALPEPPVTGLLPATLVAYALFVLIGIAFLRWTG